MSDSRREEAIRAVKNFIESVYITAEPLAEQDAAEIVGRVLAFFSLPDPEKDRLREVEKAAREVDRFLGEPSKGSPRNLAGFPLRWRFAGTRVEGDAAVALLILHDCLNDASRVRSALSEPSPSSGESEGQA